MSQNTSHAAASSKKSSKAEKSNGGKAAQLRAQREAAEAAKTREAAEAEAALHDASLDLHDDEAMPETQQAPEQQVGDHASRTPEQQAAFEAERDAASAAMGLAPDGTPAPKGKAKKAGTVRGWKAQANAAAQAAGAPAAEGEGGELDPHWWHKLGPAQARAVMAARIAGRVQALGEALKGWACLVGEGDAQADVMNTARVHFDTAVAALNGAATALKRAPTDWSPKAPSVASENSRVQLAEGMRVDVRDTARKSYEGLVDDGDLVGLTVVVVHSGKVKAKTAKGETLFFPRGHIVPAPAVAPDAAK